MRTLRPRKSYAPSNLVAILASSAGTCFLTGFGSAFVITYGWSDLLEWLL